METTNKPNINSQNYWNGVYGNPDKKAEYVALTATGKYQVIGPVLVHPTWRIPTAVDHVRSEDKVLDIGCGVGVFTTMVKKKFPKSEVWGVDISDRVIEDNKKENPDIIYHQQFVGNLDKVPVNYFDTVFAGELLEHLDDPSILIKDACKVLKPGGRLILTTPQGHAIESGEHVWYFDKADVKKLFEENGFDTPEFIDLPDLEYLKVIFAIGVKK